MITTRRQVLARSCAVCLVLMAFAGVQLLGVQKHCVAEEEVAAGQSEPRLGQRHEDGTFEGMYRHRAGNGDYSASGKLVLKQSEDGAVTAIAELPFRSTTWVAFGNAEHQLTEYKHSKPASADDQGYELTLRFEQGKVVRTRRGIFDDEDGSEIPVPSGGRCLTRTRGRTLTARPTSCFAGSPRGGTGQGVRGVRHG